jgi:hypothetical protein
LKVPGGNRWLPKGKVTASEIVIVNHIQIITRFTKKYKSASEQVKRETL